MHLRLARQAAILVLSFSLCAIASAQDPLPSWNGGPTKKSITDFVAGTKGTKGDKGDNTAGCPPSRHRGDIWGPRPP